MLRAFVLGSAILALLELPARGASFDCTQAKAPLEQAICSDQPLSDADFKTNALYTVAMTKLSPQGRQLLEDSQRGWLHFLSQVCPIAPDLASRANTAECLLKQYSERIQDLEQVAIEVGPFLFSRVDHYSVSHLAVVPNGFSDIVTHHSAIPRIDRPISQLTTRWNEIVARPDDSSEPDCGAGDGDTSLGYQLGYASARVISVRWVMYFYCPGTPHGYGTSEVQTLVLSPSPHPLQTTDVFRSDSAWEKRLDGLVLAGVRDAAAREHFALDEYAERAVNDLVADPKNWTLTNDGIEIEFGPYVLGAGRNFHPNVTLPWHMINGFLVSNPPVP